MIMIQKMFGKCHFSKWPTCSDGYGYLGFFGMSQNPSPQNNKYILKMRCGGGRRDLKAEDRKVNPDKRGVRRGPEWRQAKKNHVENPVQDQANKEVGSYKMRMERS